jgi:division protein CdvB (Snf7/Vps24/ESCRT-III family)
MTGSNQTPAMTAAIDSSSIKLDEEAMDILQEATSLLEENTKDKFPDLPLSEDRVVSSTKAANFLNS